MRPFDEILDLAAERHGGLPALEARLAATASRTPDEIAATPDDRVLSEMSRRVFQAGFVWSVIDAKWPGFEAAFDGFDPAACAMMSEERFDALLKDQRIVRNGAKVRSVIRNAQFVRDLAAEYGSAAACFACWPDDDYVNLLDLIKRRGDRLGGLSGMRLLRAIGKPAFITSESVTQALVREGVVEREPTSRRDLLTVQAAFNTWCEQSGRDLTTLSRILAMSVGEVWTTSTDGHRPT